MIPFSTLKALDIFLGVPGSAIEALAKRGVELAFPANAVVFLTGSEPRGWYIVIEGSVRVVRGSGGRQHVIHTEGVGGTLGEVPLFTDGTHPATALASQPTRCALFDRAALEAAIRESPEIAFLLARRLALRVESLVERLHERSSQNVQARVIEFLLARVANRENVISLGMTQQALAEELGTVREVISREIRALVRKGLIEALGGGRYRLLDIASLNSISASED